MKKMLFFVTAAMALVACESKNPVENTPFQKGDQVTIGATIKTLSSNNSRKVAPESISTGSQNQLLWSADDAIKLFVGTDGAQFSLTEGAGTNEGSFTGTMPADGDSYAVIYPYQEAITYDGSVFTGYSVPTTQNYVANSFDNGLMIISGMGTLEDGFVLNNYYTGILQLNLTGTDKVGSIVLTDKTNSVDYTLDCGEDGVQLSSTATAFYFVLPEGALASGFDAQVNNMSSEIITTLSTDKDNSIVAGYIKAMGEKVVKGLPVGALKGLFSVSATQQVYFSKGNLQYQASSQTWRFAENQWSAIGNNAGNNVTDGRDSQSDRIDIFRFGTSGNTTAPYVLNTTQTTFTAEDDWGVHNAISNGGNVKGQWRTLTGDEWKYLLNTSKDTSKPKNYRPDAANKWSYATVNTQKGLIILPDEWTLPSGCTFTAGVNNTFGTNVYTSDKWTLMEEAGAAFLPCAGEDLNGWYGTPNIMGVNDMGIYWASDTKSGYGPYCITYQAASGYQLTVTTSGAYYGHSVRLVQNK